MLAPPAEHDTLRLGSLVVTYHRPGPLRSVLQSLRAQTRQPDTVLVFDNGASPAVGELVRGFPGLRTQYVAADNVGMSGGVTLGFAALRAGGCDSIHLTGDGEALEGPATLERRVAILERTRSAGVVCSAGGGSRWNWRTGEAERIPSAELSGVVDVDVCGSNMQPVFAAEAFEERYLPTQELFWGFEDLEQCLKIRSGGLRIVIDGDECLASRRRHGRVNLGKRPRGHRRVGYGSLWRVYYMSRNYVWCMRRVFGRDDLARRELVRAGLRSLHSLRGGLRYASGMARMCLLGVADGYRGRLGARFLPALDGGSYPLVHHTDSAA